MKLTPERRACLQAIVNHGGSADHDDEFLAPYCDEASTLSVPDVFNQCHDAGWLISFHDDRTDTSYVRITDAGHSVLALPSAVTEQQRGEEK